MSAHFTQYAPVAVILVRRKALKSQAAILVTAHLTRVQWRVGLRLERQGNLREHMCLIDCVTTTYVVLSECEQSRM